MDGVNRTAQSATAELRAKKTAEQAEQLLRCLGGDSVILRISTGLSNDDARGLGLTAMSFEDIEFSPAMMMTRSDGTRVLQIAAASVSRLAEASASKANDMLACVTAVVREDKLIPVKKIEPQYIGQHEYIYNLVLSE